jgi:hypothetical protein
VFLFSNFGDNKEVKEQYMKIITDFSARTGDEATRVMGMFTNPDGTPNTTMQAEFIGNVSTQANDKEASKYIDFFAEVANTNGVFDMTAILNYYMTNPKVAEKTQGIIDNIEKNKGKLNLDVMTNFLPENVMGAIDTDYFNKLSQTERLTYLKEIATLVNIPDPEIAKSDDYLKWEKEGAMYDGVSYASKSVGEKISAYRKFQPYKVTQSAIEQAATAAPAKTNTGTGTKIDSSPLDELLKKLRDVRKGSIKVTKGFDASFKSLNKIFGGTKTIQAFSGIENQMRSLGAGEDLIELIAGMDPEEFERQKKKLFTIENGKIVKLKDGVRSIGDALQSIALGDFVSTQDRMVKNIGNQNAALERLQAAGVDGSVALEMVADASTAAAIANSKLSDAQLKKVIAAADRATAAQKRFAAVQAIEGNNSDIKERSDLYARLVKNVGEFSQAEIKAILNNPALIAGLLTGAKNFAEGLKKELSREQIELNLKLKTVEGLQSIFDDGFGNAMEAFDVQETALRIDFDIKNEGLMDEIKKAEEQIALNQEKIRKEEIGLKEIQDQEDKINETYDKRLDALDEIERANASVSQQQKGQLTLAEALTSGDIAAAARAAQEMRAQEAANNVTKQKEALEQSREYEISQVRSTGGKSRLEIEKEIKRLQDEIYEIEQKSLEPNRETLRLNELALAKAIEGLTVLGKTREQWEAIKNLVDLAKIASADFVKKMQDALAIYEKLIQEYKNQKASTDPILPATIPVDPVVPVDPVDPKKEPVIDIHDPTDVVVLGTYKPKPTPYIEPKPKPKIDPPEPKPIKYKTADEARAAALAAEAARLAAKRKEALEISLRQDKAAADRAKTAAETAKRNSLLNKFGGNAAAADAFGNWGNWSMGGLIPKYFAVGGFAKGTDTVPAMLTPGEFIMSKYAVDSYGVDNMRKINNGDSIGGTVYNNTYTLTVNAKTNANPNEIAQAVMSTIKRVDDRRIKGVSLNAR